MSVLRQEDMGLATILKYVIFDFGYLHVGQIKGQGQNLNFILFKYVVLLKKNLRNNLCKGLICPNLDLKEGEDRLLYESN